MNPDERRQLENELMARGMPTADDPALAQVVADVVNAYPIMGERVEFFCELLNQCVGERRREMYEALRPCLAFEVPALDVCEARIAAMAERLIRPNRMPGKAKNTAPVELTIEITCGGCKKVAEYSGHSPADAMSYARKAGWGRGPVRGLEYCAECRLAAMPAKAFGESFTRRVTNRYA